MQSTQNQPQPARLRLAAGLLAVGLLGVLLFCVVLYFVFSTPARFNASAYETEVPEEVVWQVETHTEGGRLVVEGWALELHRHIEKVDIWVLLYDDETGVYYRLPTTLVVRDELYTDLPYAHTNWVNGGFTAEVGLSRLKKPAAEYELCLAFGHNQMQVLIHTGEAAA